MLLVGCSTSPGPTSPAASPGPSPGASSSPSPSGATAAVTAAITALAQRFAAQAVGGDFGAQWAELAPQAQALWPGEAARTAMLTAKFSGAAISSIALGPAVSGVTWYDPESPVISVADTWRFPLTVSFADPGALQPPGVAALFSMTTLSVAYDTAAGTAEVVGEGPCSIDAPVIVPATVTPRQVDVPLYMYHLVQPAQPVRSQYGSNTYGYEIAVGLTTLTSQFQAEMAYAHSIGATSISLQHLADALLYGLPLPPHCFVVTFDDGFLNQWTDAVPILRQYGFTAVFFPCTALVGGDYGPLDYMTGAQIRELAATGFSVGDHTLNDQTALWGDSTSLLSTLTNQSKSVLEALTDQPIQFIAYSGPWPSSWPQSGPGGAEEEALFRTLDGFGYVGGLQDLTFDTATDISTQLMQLPRVRVGLGVTTDGWGRFVESSD
jgi:peptidoglycan/xylan/chitin deacetylase (PgdA/CDA1 family)